MSTVGSSALVKSNQATGTADDRGALGLPEAVAILGVRMQPWTMRRTIEEIDRRLQRSEFTHHVVINVAKLVHLRDDPELRAAVEDCDIVNVDGMGVVWGARFLGIPIPERVPGVDLFFALLELSVARGYPVYLLGARPDVIEEVVERLTHEYPGLEIAGYHHGYFWGDEEHVVSRIRSSGARLLFVGISSPQKEQFIHRWKGGLGVTFAMGVGGTFDIVAGVTRRAPRWMQRAGMEWLFRVLQEPRRLWKRYLFTNLRFLQLIAQEKLRVTRWSEAAR